MGELGRRYYEVFMFVWHPFVDDHLKMGWMLDGPPVERGGEFDFIMIWPCKCEVPCLKKSHQ